MPESTQLTADAPPIAAPLGLSSTVFTDQASGSLVTQPHFAVNLPVVELKGVRIHSVTEAQSVQHILEQLDAGKGGWVVTPNLDHLRRLTRDRKLRALYSHASLVVADGMPLIWASRIQ